MNTLFEDYVSVYQLHCKKYNIHFKPVKQIQTVNSQDLVTEFLSIKTPPSISIGLIVPRYSVYSVNINNERYNSLASHDEVPFDYLVSQANEVFEFVEDKLYDKVANSAADFILAANCICNYRIHKLSSKPMINKKYLEKISEILNLDPIPEVFCHFLEYPQTSLSELKTM